MVYSNKHGKAWYTVKKVKTWYNMVYSKYSLLPKI